MITTALHHPFSEQGMKDPYPLLAAFRRLRPAFFDQSMGMWLLTSHELCRAGHAGPGVLGCRRPISTGQGRRPTDQHAEHGWRSAPETAHPRGSRVHRPRRRAARGRDCRRGPGGPDVPTGPQRRCRRSHRGAVRRSGDRSGHRGRAIPVARVGRPGPRRIGQPQSCSARRAGHRGRDRSDRAHRLPLPRGPRPAERVVRPHVIGTARHPVVDRGRGLRATGRSVRHCDFLDPGPPGHGRAARGPAAPICMSGRWTKPCAWNPRSRSPRGCASRVFAPRTPRSHPEQRFSLSSAPPIVTRRCTTLRMNSRSTADRTRTWPWVEVCTIVWAQPW